MTKTVFITGAASGLGLAAAHKLDQSGWRVFAGAMPDEDVTALTENTSDNLTVVPIDITDSGLVTSAAQRIAERIGDNGLDALVNNAGILIVGPLEALPISMIRRQFDVNVFGHIEVTRAFLPLLRRSGNARIVNTSSILGLMSTPLVGAYSMSKHALEAFTTVLRLELKEQGIEVIAVRPGAINTGMAKNTPQDADTMWQKVDSDLKPLYQKLFTAMRGLWAKQDQTAPDASEVAELIVRALTDKRPKTHYLARDARMIPLLKFAPSRIADTMIRRTIGIK